MFPLRRRAGSAEKPDSSHEHGVVQAKEEWHNTLTVAYNAALAEEARSGQMPPLAVIFMDVNHFKDVNDVLGHSRGDMVIDDIRNIIAGQIRLVQSETPDNNRSLDVLSVSPAQLPKEKGLIKYIPGHLGGDEYAILAKTDDKGALAMGERIRTAVNKYLGNPENSILKDVDISLSVGVAVLQPRMSMDELLYLADNEMKEDKLKQLRVLSETERQEVNRILADLSRLEIRHRDIGKYALLLARQKASGLAE